MYPQIVYSLGAKSRNQILGKCETILQTINYGRFFQIRRVSTRGSFWSLRGAEADRLPHLLHSQEHSSTSSLEHSLIQMHKRAVVGEPFFVAQIQTTFSPPSESTARWALALKHDSLLDTPMCGSISWTCAHSALCYRKADSEDVPDLNLTSTVTVNIRVTVLKVRFCNCRSAGHNSDNFGVCSGITDP